MYHQTSFAIRGTGRPVEIVRCGCCRSLLRTSQLAQAWRLLQTTPGSLGRQVLLAGSLHRNSHDALCGADRARTTEYTSRTATHQQNQQALEAILAGLGLSITLPQVQRATRGHGWCQLPMALLIDLVEMVSGLSAFAPGNLTRAVASASTRAPRRLAPSRMPAPLALLPLADPLSSGLPAT
jgi:hypothetical protein